jgi:hypothetical protein
MLNLNERNHIVNAPFVWMNLKSYHIRTLPLSSHSFHVVSIDTWLTKQPNCPLCSSCLPCAQFDRSSLRPIMADRPLRPIRQNKSLLHLFESSWICMRILIAVNPYNKTRCKVEWKHRKKKVIQPWMMKLRHAKLRSKHINQRNHTRSIGRQHETKDEENIIHSKSIRKVSLQFKGKQKRWNLID